MKLLYITFFLCFYQNIQAQKKYFSESTTKIRGVTAIDNDTLVKCSVLRETPEISCNLKKNYYWYSTNQVHKNRGGIHGKVLHGKVTRFNLEGNLIVEGQIRKGLKVGKWKEWHPNGELKSISNYRRGMKYGREFHYNPDGLKIILKRYRKDVLLKEKNLTKKKEVVKHSSIDGKNEYQSKSKRRRGIQEKKQNKNKKLEIDILDESGTKKKKKEDRQKIELYNKLKNLFRSKEDENIKIS